MDMTLPSHDWLKPAGDSPEGASRPLDWHGLAARLAAAAACRETITGLQRALPGLAASFDPASARRLAAFVQESGEAHPECDGELSSSRVNLVDSVEGKPASAIRFDTAGVVKTGDRGLA